MTCMRPPQHGHGVGNTRGSSAAALAGSGLGATASSSRALAMLSVRLPLDRIEGPERWKTMTLTPHQFIRRFLIHVLPKGFHRIRHYGLLANTNRAESIARARELLGAAPRIVEPEEQKAPGADEPRVLPCPCPRCGGRMIVIEVFARGCEPRYRPTPTPAPIRIDTS